MYVCLFYLCLNIRSKNPSAINIGYKGSAESEVAYRRDMKHEILNILRVVIIPIYLTFKYVSKSYWKETLNL